MSQTDCRWCTRAGLPILPLRIAYVPGGVDLIPSDMTADLPTPLHAGKYMLRVITEGYVYTYDTRHGGFWRCFAATPNGLFKEYIVNNKPDSTPAFSCEREGHSLDASLINVDNADAAGEVWVGYSRVWWTKAVLNDLASSSKRRNALMTRIDAGALASGGEVPAKAGFRCTGGLPLGSAFGTLASHVLEYSATPANAGPVDLPGAIAKPSTFCEDLYASGTLDAAVDRTNQGGELTARMSAICEHGGVALGLHDPVGLAADAAGWRNIKAGKLAEFEVTKADARSRIVGDTILGLKESIDPEVWADRYAGKVDMARLQDDKDRYEKKKAELTQPIKAASKDWLALIDRDVWSKALATYDGSDDVEIGLALERDFAACVQGSGAFKAERDWWDKCLAAAPDDEKHPLWPALAAGDPDVMAYIKKNATKAGEAFKNAMDAKPHFDTWLESRASQGLVRSARDASGVIAGVLVSQLPRLVKSQPQLVETLGARLRIVVATRLDTVITPYSTKVTMQEAAGMLYETVWGPPRAGMTQTVRQAQSALITQSMDGAFLGGRFTSTTMLELDVWLPEEQIKAAASASPAAIASAASRGATAALPSAGLNPYTAMRNYLTSGEARIVGLGAALAMYNLVAALMSLDKALKATGPNADDKVRESAFGVVSGVLGAGAAISEFSGGVIAKRVTAATAKAATTSLLTRAALFRLGGGLLATAAAWTQAVQSLGKYFTSDEEGDTDAANAYGIATGLYFASGLLAAAPVIIGAGAALSAAGATGTLASMTIGMGSALTLGATITWIPVVGWIVGSLVLLGAAVYFGFVALQNEDTPLEIWLSRSYYRNVGEYADTTREPYPNPKVEMAAFQDAIYGLHIRFDWNDEWFGKDEISMRVIMPGYSDHSAYAYALQARGGDGPWGDIYSKASAFSHDPDLQPDKTLPTMSAIDPDAEIIPLDEVMTFPQPPAFTELENRAVLSARVRVNEDYFSRARLKIEYWPDAVNNLKLTMTPVGNGVNFKEIID